MQDSSHVSTVHDWQVRRLITGGCVSAPKVLNLPFKDGIRRADRDNAIDLYIGEEYMDVLADGAWPKTLYREAGSIYQRGETRMVRSR